MQSNKPVKEDRRVQILNLVALGVFSIAAVVGTIKLFDEATRSSGVLIVLCSALGIFFSFLSKIVRHFWQAEVPLYLLLIIYFFIFLGTIPGEIFNFYYTVWWWDIFLHIFSGFWITYILFRVFSAVFTKSKIKLSFGFIAFIAIFSSLGFAVIWEVTEFTIDSLFNTNMQKFIPPEFLPHNTGSVEALDATDSAIVDYYRQPSGYRYALMDTMEDHIAFLSGSLLWLLVFGSKNLAHRPNKRRPNEQY